ncbi:hypothetical protein [Leucobacter aridicollis]|uniref:hypothetical protein n=1 Tax=Leucobacter aridicollis TaxID=283878 RepID=UPI00216981D4|nr:hypothetical protein [Leucobacter aridicollis]MCS3426735.1 hypothetical protein [Leucobacter aridicollis]
MSFYTQALIAADQDIVLRVTACAARERVQDPHSWTAQRMWEFSAQPGWREKYASALASGVQDPGRDEWVITDADILAAVQSILAPLE